MKYNKSQLLAFFWDLELIILVSVFLSALLIGLSELTGFFLLHLIRIPLGFYFLFFPSGFLFLSLLFPGKKLGLEKIALSFASSLALTGLFTLALNLVFGLPISVLFFLSLIAFASAVFYVLFKSRQLIKGVDLV